MSNSLNGEKESLIKTLRKWVPIRKDWAMSLNLLNTCNPRVSKNMIAKYPKIYNVSNLRQTVPTTICFSTTSPETLKAKPMNRVIKIQFRVLPTAKQLWAETSHMTSLAIIKQIQGLSLVFWAPHQLMVTVLVISSQIQWFREFLMQVYQVKCVFSIYLNILTPNYEKIFCLGFNMASFPCPSSTVTSFSNGFTGLPAAADCTESEFTHTPVEFPVEELFSFESRNNNESSDSFDDQDSSSTAADLGLEEESGNFIQNYTYKNS